jgi:hypothetical protein
MIAAPLPSAPIVAKLWPSLCLFATLPRVWRIALGTLAAMQVLCHAAMHNLAIACARPPTPKIRPFAGPQYPLTYFVRFSVLEQKENGPSASKRKGLTSA